MGEEDPVESIFHGVHISEEFKKTLYNCMTAHFDINTDPEVVLIVIKWLVSNTSLEKLSKKLARVQKKRLKNRRGTVTPYEDITQSIKELYKEHTENEIQTRCSMHDNRTWSNTVYKGIHTGIGMTATASATASAAEFIGERFGIPIGLAGTLLGRFGWDVMNVMNGKNDISDISDVVKRAFQIISATMVSLIIGEMIKICKEDEDKLELYIYGTDDRYTIEKWLGEYVSFMAHDTNNLVFEFEKDVLKLKFVNNVMDLVDHWIWKRVFNSDDRTLLISKESKTRKKWYKDTFDEKMKAMITPTTSVKRLLTEGMNFLGEMGMGKKLGLGGIAAAGGLYFLYKKSQRKKTRYHVNEWVLYSPHNNPQYVYSAYVVKNEGHKKYTLKVYVPHGRYGEYWTYLLPHVNHVELKKYPRKYQPLGSV